MTNPPDNNGRVGVLAAGNWLVDHVKVIDSWPQQDGLANVLGRSAGNGGGPYNVLKDLAKLRAPFPLAGLGLLGDDSDGRAILADCRAHGIDTSRFAATTVAATSSTDVMTVKDTGRRTFFHHRGANAMLSAEHFSFVGAQARIFYLGYLLLLDSLDAPGSDGRPRSATVLAAARAAGMRTIVDCVSAPGPQFRTSVLPVLSEVDVLFANDYEAEQLTGESFGRGGTLNRPAIERAAAQLARSGVRERVVIHFPEGACSASVAGDTCWQPAVSMPPTEVAGTAGAGDAFAAGVIYGLHENWSIQRSLELGVCAAAASLRHPTCSESVVPAADCLALGVRYGFRRGS